ncbi:MAG: OmpA family protein [Candidatus Cloacimonadota bacterium]|nr:OmpA family protein [Candidatus Cloacimonadota bacterium]
MKTKYIVLLFLFVISGCASTKYVEDVPKGVHKKKILIKSEPTKAKIYINDKYLGTTPVKTELWYSHRTSLNIKAEPLYPRQIPQNIFLKVPPIPDKMTIFMDYKPKSRAELDDNDELIPDKIISEEIPIIQKVAYNFPIIYFDFDKFNIKESEEGKLKEVSEVIKKNQNYILAIHGYADERGSLEYNKTLSLQRANSTKTFLEKLGVNPEQLRVYGHGEVPTLTSSGYELEFKNNRIVYFKLYEKPEQPPGL